MTLTMLGRALDSAVRNVVHPHSMNNRRVTKVTLAEPSELVANRTSADGNAALVLAGVSELQVIAWLDSLAHSAPEDRPVAAIIKETIASASLKRSATNADISLILLDPRARLNSVLKFAQDCVERANRNAQHVATLSTGQHIRDLFDLAEVVADGTGGMVSIEDASETRVLAYSRSTKAADALRTQSILGRQPLSKAMQVFRKTGVAGRLRSTSEAFSIAKDAQLGTEPRIAAGIHDPNGTYLGSIWVQQGSKPLLPETFEVVQGAAATASEIIVRSINSPSITELTLHRLFDETEGVDERTAQTFLGIASDEPFTVIGFAIEPSNLARMGSLGRLLLLQMRALSPKAHMATIDGCTYFLLPAAKPETAIVQWVEHLVDRVERRQEIGGHHLRAVVAAPVIGLNDLAAARSEVDTVLRHTRSRSSSVTTLTDSRTSVLLGQILRPLKDRNELKDPRISLISEYDRKHSSTLFESIRMYLRSGNNVRRAAKNLKIHPNTLQYRISRAQEISGLDFSDSDDRLLTSIQIAISELDS